MKHTIKLTAALIVAFIVAALGRRLVIASNTVGIHDDADGGITRSTEDELPERYLLVTPGTDPAREVALCGATDEPSGVADDAAAAGTDVSVLPFGSATKTRLMVASKAIAAGARIYTTAGGKVTDTAVNNSWLVGKSWSPAGADLDEIEVEPCFPVQQSV